MEGVDGPRDGDALVGTERLHGAGREIDFRVGGKMPVRDAVARTSTRASPIWSTGVYREIVPFERIVVTDCFADEKGNVVPASHYGMRDDFPLEMLLTVTFEDLGGGRRR